MNKLFFNEETLKNSKGPYGIGNLVKEELPGRNEPCPCGSGKKFKRCCIYDSMYSEQKEYIPVNSSNNKHSLRILTSVKKLRELRSRFSSDISFFKDGFFPIWNSLGNQFIENFQLVWGFISNLKIRQFNFDNVEDVNTILLRCMTIEEFTKMKETNQIQSPSWTSNSDYVFNFKNFPIITRMTNEVVMVAAMFNLSDVVYFHSVESEHFMRKGTTPIKFEILQNWTPKDVEEVLGPSIENLYITHKECDNSFDNYISVYKKRGIELNGFYHNGVLSCKDKTGKKTEFLNKLQKLIKLWKSEVTDRLVA